MELLKLKNCGFDAIRDFVIDPMHNVFLGVTKTLASYWFGQKYSKHPCSIRKKVKLVDQILKQIANQVPHEFSRAPRGIEHNFNHYKGTYYTKFNFFNVLLSSVLLFVLYIYPLKKNKIKT